MGKERKIAVLCVLALIVGVLVAGLGYVFADFIVVGTMIEKNALQYVQSTTSPPSNYKSNFGVWHVTYNKETDSYNSTLTVPDKTNIIKTLSGASSDGLVVDTEAFEQALQNAKGNIAGNIAYYKNSIENCEGLKDYNSSTLAIAIYANIASEGTPLQWENTSDTKDSAQDYIYTHKDGDNVYLKCKCDCSLDQDFIFAVKVNEGWYTQTKGQYQNMYSHIKAGCKNLEKASIGFGSVQWTGSRTLSYVKYMWDNCISSQPDSGYLDVTAVKDVEKDYICMDVADCFSRNKFPTNPSDKDKLSLTQITAWIASMFECPYYSAQFQMGRKDKEPFKFVACYKDTKNIAIEYNKSNYNHATVAAMWNGGTNGIWDFDKYDYYWLKSDGSVGNSITESYRVNRAKKYYEEVMGGN